MSFFGFDTSGPASGNVHGSSGNSNKPLDFEDTYRGFGEYEREEDDYLNDETFGAEVEFGTDFDFGHSNLGGGASGSRSANVSGQGATTSGSYATNSRSYAVAASSAPVQQQQQQQQPMDTNLDMRPMESLWGNEPVQNMLPPQLQQQQPQQQQQQQQPSQPPQPPQQQQNVMPQGPLPGAISMEELERQQRQMQISNQQTFIQGYPHQPIPQGNAQFGNQYQMNMPPGIPGQYQQMPPQMFPQQQQGQQQQFPPQMYPQQQMNFMSQQFQPPQPHMLQQKQPQQPQQQMQQPQQQAPQQQPVQQQPSQQQQLPPQQLQHADVESLASSDASQKYASSLPTPPHQHSPLYQQREGVNQNTMRESNRRMSKRGEPLSPEEQKRLQIRQAKVEKILKNAGLMTPRDKDFITRYQLSQIVTEDPYNEDFYYQVYKIIQSGGIAGKSNKDLIARAYLEHSGHRLGGRYKRADVALQRMQNQVEKAVTVAKERPQKNKDHSDIAREGVLGKISSAMNSKAPRRQLQIPSPKSGEEEDEELSGKLSNASTPVLEEVTESLNNVGISENSRSRRRSSYAFSSVDQSSVLSRSGGRKFVLSLIESVYEVVLELEAQLRSGKTTDNSSLWESLHIGDESFEVCPFISMLSFDKGVKIIPRIFNFLDKQQKLQLLQTFFSELSHLNVIIISSFKTNPSPTDSQLKKIELFQAVFLKIIVSFLSSSANFIEIMGLLLHLIRNNNVSFISTSKLGLNLITILISRAALIKQDSNRTNSLSSPDIQAWNEVYDKLFISLETKLSLVFPPKDYQDKVVKETSSSLPSSSSSTGSSPQQSSPQYYDQAYIWQFLASLALSGKLNHQRIIIDEIRDEIFGTINSAEDLTKANPQDQSALYRREKLYQDLNLFLNVMGLVARNGEISELK
ncbi:hypothetical protein Kpol_1028p33 [Vanderwaltozyma polyspora DSM 70294]|uniref:mRNA decay factor PAT1 domain-containing protein n=1 Tax=Vanderwaltozyma polyspora (strain ATCC 22028 / DSM 70294 / BCRC 21397 / CBS 2163 / NBRC 10782 / NRRL Y-8283 / UCD 57-17) TaxID=436907 RepID=A7TG03_VANPO|nr:uncharacterized protein Kpol_1028p33 [Vanderwaltozyma polyspora DSM 70294]EDO18760.1 hypothetical protein Kpol_1028p33 [Vanderwaltozyma polyspora DSM 70294]